ncbi:MAG: class I SAM-dependent methyltransferase [Lachnospiraceae bacterium]|nr:class I SAM-dependent methyltransferase [Lachnospiraceae bacterium]
MVLYSEPYVELKEKIGLSEMSEFENSFVCGLIKEKRPSKILEIGVAAGGTTTVIMNCLNKLNLASEMYSVDLSPDYYRNPEKKCGFLVDEIGISISGKYQLYTGNVIAEYIEEIGSNIDFLIIDTIHSCPGEILDFLAVLPFLKDHATVVLHDVGMHYEYSPRAFATQLLMDVVSADIILENDDSREGGYPNIAAFTCNDGTKAYLYQVFSALNISWSYVPKEQHLESYRKIYRQYYSKELLDVFEVAVQLNKKCLQRNRDKVLSGIAELSDLLQWVKDADSVYIYGKGDRGSKIYDILEQNHIHICSYIVTKKSQEEDDCVEIKDAVLAEKDKVIVAASGFTWKAMVVQLNEKKICNYKVISDNINILLGMI